MTLDWVNPASRWPLLSSLAAACAAEGKLLLPRLPVYPEHIQQAGKWLDTGALPHDPADAPAAGSGQRSGPALSTLARTLACADAAGYARASGWYAGQTQPPDSSPADEPETASGSRWHVQRARWAVELGTDGALAGCEAPPVTPPVQAVMDRLAEVRCAAAAGGAGGRGDGEGPGVDDVEVLLLARGQSAQAVVQCADELRRSVCGDHVTYVVNRNINYTNVCTYGCDTLRYELLRLESCNKMLSCDACV